MLLGILLLVESSVPRRKPFRSPQHDPIADAKPGGGERVIEGTSYRVEGVRLSLDKIIPVQNPGKQQPFTFAPASTPPSNPFRHFVSSARAPLLPSSIAESANEKIQTSGTEQSSSGHTSPPFKGRSWGDVVPDLFPWSNKQAPNEEKSQAPPLFSFVHASRNTQDFADISQQPRSSSVEEQPVHEGQPLYKEQPLHEEQPPNKQQPLREEQPLHKGQPPSKEQPIHEVHPLHGEQPLQEDQPLHEEQPLQQEPVSVLRTPATGAPKTPPDPSAIQGNIRVTPTLRTDDKVQNNSFLGDESPSSKSESLPCRSDPDEPGCFRYHVYEIRRKTGSLEATVLHERLDLLSEDSDGSDYYPGDSSGSESGEHWNSEWETESEDGSDDHQVDDSENESEGGSVDSHDTGWDKASYRPSGFGFSEVGSSYNSENEVSVEENSVGANDDIPAHQDDGDGDFSADSGYRARDLRPTLGYVFKEADKQSLKKMALSAISGEELANLPKMRILIKALGDQDLHQWSLQLWHDRHFKPALRKVRHTLMRDLNTCLALKNADGDLLSVNVDFDGLWNSPSEEAFKAFSLLFGDGDRVLRQRVCGNLIRLNRAPYYTALLSYLWVEDDKGWLEDLGEEALWHLYFKHGP